MRAGLRAFRCSLLAGLFAIAALFSFASPGLAQRKPLTEREQKLVDRAIEEGVRFLKRTQNDKGDWPRKDAAHAIGYTAFPALTLLECGMPADDPIIATSAKRVRRLAPKLETTYEIALSILFLDRLDDPADVPLIRTLATRLIAGQTVTGGWGYKCPQVGPRDRSTILIALRKLDPNPPMLGQVRRPGDRPMKGIDRENPGIGGFPVGGGRPGLDKGLQTGDKSALSGGTKDRPGTESTSPGEKGATKDLTTPPVKPGEQDAPLDQTKREGGIDHRPAQERERMPIRLSGRRWLGCIREVEETGQAVSSPAKSARVADVVPQRLRQLPIFQEGPALLADPEKRANEAMAATTDNSNTQFAILALWAASRHEVTLIRTMRLVVRRFATSQNRDGSWGYRYSLGGGLPERPAMTCVGLLGLAIGQALTERPVAEKVDPAILGGFVALSKNVGTAVDGNQVPPLANLYLLWSIERVAVLYNMPTIGEKDWYRWAAQLLVAHQQPGGQWTNGGYHGAHPIIDTCLALLVLKRVDLARDLGERIAIDPKKLDRAILGKDAPTPRDPPKQDSPPLEPPPIGTGTMPLGNSGQGGSIKPETPPATTFTPSPPLQPPPRGVPIWAILLLVVAGLALAGGVTCVVWHLKNRNAESAEEKPRREPRSAKTSRG